MSPSGSGKTSGSFFTPLIWNRLARTFAISVTWKNDSTINTSSSTVTGFGESSNRRAVHLTISWKIDISNSSNFDIELMESRFLSERGFWQLDVKEEGWLLLASEKWPQLLFVWDKIDLNSQILSMEEFSESSRQGLDATRRLHSMGQSTRNLGWPLY